MTCYQIRNVLLSGGGRLELVSIASIPYVPRQVRDKIYKNALKSQTWAKS